MAVVTNFTITGTKNIEISEGVANAAMISLVQGGAAAVADLAGRYSRGVTFDSDGNQTASFVVPGNNAKIAQLSNSILVVASLVDEVIHTTLIDISTGASIVSINESEYMATGLSLMPSPHGGFWLLSDTHTQDSLPVDIYSHLNLRISTFNLVTPIVDYFGARAVRYLGNSRTAVAWSQQDLDSTEVWFKIYRADGTVFKSNTPLDRTVRANQQLAITSTPNGFAIAYEDEVDGESGIRVVSLNAEGIVLAAAFFNSPGNDAKPNLVSLPEGRLLLSFDNNMNPDTDTEFAILSSNLTIEFNFPISGAFPEHDQESSVAASMGYGNFAILHEDKTTGGISGELIYTAIEHTSDEESDRIVGTDSYSNIMHGNDGNDTLVGGQQDDQLSGGGGNDMLSGGAGEDTMHGGLGNDTFYVDSMDDSPHELAGQGALDRLYASVNYILADNEYIEYLYVNSTSGRSLSGNNLDNRLFGNVQNDTLGGGGGNDIIDGKAGADEMAGGDGNDTYYVDNVNDRILETSTGGSIDRVYSRVNYTLTAGQYIEALYASGATAGMNLAGNELGNQVYGSAFGDTLAGGGGIDRLTAYAGNDTLLGGDGVDTIFGGANNDRIVGGAGIDSLYGEAGSDTFVLTPGAADYDNIRDFVSGADRIEISASLFGSGLAAGALSGLQFIVNGSGLASDFGNGTTRFIYNSSNGQLFYDADGTGAGARVRIANLIGTPSPALAIGDFAIVG